MTMRDSEPVVTNRLSNTLHCAAGCGHPIRLGERMTRRSEGIFNWNTHYPSCPMQTTPEGEES